MKTIMHKLIRLIIEDNTKLDKFDSIYTLDGQLQYCENLNEMVETLIEWLYEKYEVVDVNFSLFDLESEKSTQIYKKGKEFYLDDKFAFYFIINTHTKINAVVSFNVDNQKQYDYINKDKDFIDAAFSQISPVLQNGIIKKHHIESASIDSVTNVHNRKYLIHHIKKIISLSKKEEDNISFLMIGIDRFKAVIEEFDYDVGDIVLVELAKIIHKNIRDFDIVSRLTGDEFLVALVNVKSKDAAYSVAERIINEFSKTEIIVNNVTKQILKKTICIGISSFPHDGENINQVLKNADNFLNEAKNKGRSQIAVYTKEDNSTIDLF